MPLILNYKLSVKSDLNLEVTRFFKVIVLCEQSYRKTPIKHVNNLHIFINTCPKLKNRSYNHNFENSLKKTDDLCNCIGRKSFKGHYLQDLHVKWAVEVSQILPLPSFPKLQLWCWTKDFHGSCHLWFLLVSITGRDETASQIPSCLLLLCSLYGFLANPPGTRTSKAGLSPRH